MYDLLNFEGLLFLFLNPKVTFLSELINEGTREVYFDQRNLSFRHERTDKISYKQQ